MEITAQGKLEVVKSLDFAMKNYDEAKRKFLRSMEAVKRAKEQVVCEHKNLDNTGSFIYITTECKDCGYTWYD